MVPCWWHCTGRAEQTLKPESTGDACSCSKSLPVCSARAETTCKTQIGIAVALM